MYAVFALASAALYGAADFIGGLTSRRADTMLIVLISQAAGLALVALALPLVATPLPALPDWIWGSIAGIAGGVGVALLYRALAVGVMSLVAPVTAACAVAVPVIVAVLVLRERPGLLPSIGIAVALLAVALISASDEPHAQVASPEPAGVAKRKGLGLAVASGIAIGLFFLALARTSADAGLWPLLFARLSSVVFFAMLLLGSTRNLNIERPWLLLAVGGGVLDMLANLLYLLAARQGPLTLAVTLSSLYPASTVLLARVVLHERLTPRQWAGVVFAVVAIVLIVADPVPRGQNAK